MLKVRNGIYLFTAEATVDDLAEVLIYQRERLELSIRGIARASHTTKSRIADYLNGKDLDGYLEWERIKRAFGLATCNDPEAPAPRVRIAPEDYTIHPRPES